MNSSISGWLVLTRNFVAGSHPQNDNNLDRTHRITLKLSGTKTQKANLSVINSSHACATFSANRTARQEFFSFYFKKTT